MTRWEISKLLEGLASRRSGYANDSAPKLPQTTSDVDRAKIERSLKQRFGDRAPSVKGA